MNPVRRKPCCFISRTWSGQEIQVQMSAAARWYHGQIGGGSGLPIIVLRCPQLSGVVRDRPLTVKVDAVMLPQVPDG